MKTKLKLGQSSIIAKKLGVTLVSVRYGGTLSNGEICLVCHAHLGGGMSSFPIYTDVDCEIDLKDIANAAIVVREVSGDGSQIELEVLS